jgi:hypothetical protein
LLRFQALGFFIVVVGQIDCDRAATAAIFPLAAAQPFKLLILIFVIPVEAQLLFLLLLDHLIPAGGALLARAVIVNHVSAVGALELRVIGIQSSGSDGGKFHVAVVSGILPEKNAVSRQGAAGKRSCEN